ncbi:heparinase II/III family protein [Frigidibacter sp. MR17.24]|uniref:heparinase II/III family protein n=1 Tax=Frigidibacter sp. MR17.24 TaxID=3127345 RepID=UPI003012D3F7
MPDATAAEGLGSRLTRLMDRFHAWVAVRRHHGEGFTTTPEPRTVGAYARGRQLIAGNFQFAGHLVEGGSLTPWDVAAPSAAFERAAQGFAWLDDLAAVADGAARARAQAWTADWIARFGAGRGPGWTPELTGRRLIRWINNANLLLAGQEREASDRYFRSLGQQTRFLSRRWAAAPSGLPRIEALTGLIHAGLALKGMERLAGPAARALAKDCAVAIDVSGGIASRNPEEALETFVLLTWAAEVLTGAGRSVDPRHVAAIERMAPTLRALRHADGGLGRFHGGGRGVEGRLDQALAAAGVRGTAGGGASMGYVRMAGGRTTVLIDAAPPPPGDNAHASTLALELTSGRRPVVVNCGSGLAFGPDWHRAGRATPSHSTLGITGFSSSRLANPGMGRRGAQPARRFEDAPTEVRMELATEEAGLRFLGGHDGYVPTHGMTHARELVLDSHGRRLSGEDTLGALSPADAKRFDVLMARTERAGIAFDIRFHLHPDVDAALDMGGAAVSLALKSGEIWVFRHDGVGTLRLEPSVYLERGRLKPRPTRQIVLSARVMDYACQLGWTLAKAQDTPAGIRDLDRDDTTHF